MIFIGRLSRELEPKAALRAFRLNPLAYTFRFSPCVVHEVPPSTVGANFRQSTIVSGDATIVSKTAVLTTFMREISGLVRQITPLRSSLNHDRLYHTHTHTHTRIHTTLSLIFSRPWYHAISGRTKAVFSRVGHFYESGTQSCGTFLSLRRYKNAVRAPCNKWFWISIIVTIHLVKFLNKL